MYKITEELNINGFSANSMDYFIKRNGGSRSFEGLNYFCILIVINNVAVTIENIHYDLKRGSLVFIGPSKKIFFCPEADKKGSIYSLNFSASFFEKSAKDSLMLNSDLFFDESSKVVVTQASIPIDEVLKLVITRLDLYKTKQNNGLYISVAHNCVQALMLDGMFHVDEKTCKQQEDTRKFTFIDIVNRFRVLLQKHYQIEKHVSFYAELLFVTPRRLSEMTESVLGRSAKQVIIDKVVSEGIRMLKHSNFTVSEVAYELGFNDEANFSTFIKKHTTKNPRMIRHAG